MATILSIEDDPDLQHLLGLVLRNHGYEIHYAFTGQEGYEKIFSLKPDLVILDFMLPLMNGLEILTRVKADKKTRDIPVIVTTAHFDQVSFVENSIRAMGVLEYIRKPVHMPELLSLIKRTLDGADRRSPHGPGIRKGAVRLDPQFRTVWINDCLAATLPAKRFEVLRLLVESGGEVAREHLLRRVWGKSASGNNLEKTIQRLREDLGPAESARIRTTLKGYELIG